MFQEMSQNTKQHFEKFEELINKYIEEIKQNQIALFDMLSKMGIINDELSKLEELYNKVKEMRIALVQVYSVLLQNVKCKSIKL